MCGLQEKLALLYTFQSAISAGTRDRGSCRNSAYNWVSDKVNDYHQVPKVGCQPMNCQRVEQLHKSKELEKKPALLNKRATGVADSLIESAKMVDGIRIIRRPQS